MKRYWPTYLGFLAGLTAIGAGLHFGENGEHGWQLAARWTARASFPLFIVTFAASAVVRLHHAPWAKTLLRNRRWWGLGFAACFTLHVASLSIYNSLKGNFPPTGPSDPGFYVYLLMLAMVLTSTDIARRRLGKGWKVLHRLGMWAFWLVFVVNPYIGAILRLEAPKESPLADPYFLVGIAAALMKFAAWRSSRGKRVRRLVR